MDILFLVGRILFGGFFILGGLNHFIKLAQMTGYAAAKGVPMAKLAVIVSGAMAVAGGAGIVLGVYVQVSVAVLAVFLIAVTFTMHNFWRAADPASKMNEQISFMKNMALLGADLMFLMIEEPWVLGAIL